MSSIYSENSTHRQNILNAERTRQASITPTSTQAQVTAVEISFYRSCLNSAIANNCGATDFIMALWSLGVKA
jgi:hypothetical protein